MKITQHKEFAAEHAAKLPSKDDPDAVFGYVMSNHPRRGVSYMLDEPKIELTELVNLQLEEQAKYCDFVTYYCVEKVAQDPSGYTFEGANITAIGNIAYVALNHSNPLIRQQYTKTIERFRKEAASAGSGNCRIM